MLTPATTGPPQGLLRRLQRLMLYGRLTPASFARPVKWRLGLCLRTTAPWPLGFQPTLPSLALRMSMHMHATLLPCPALRSYALAHLSIHDPLCLCRACDCSIDSLLCL
uniref:Uncharacterized protein n=1 Tax=Eutreptiella gymnastica TaxID=73025 RepID=A0A7S4D2P3_9EUGL